MTPEDTPRDSGSPPVSKADIVDMLEDAANLLEITGANAFKIRAFTNAARAIESLSGDLAALAESGGLLAVPGIGKGILAHIKEILATGTFQEYAALRAQVPPGLLEMLRIPGVGPKKVRAFRETLGITTVDELEQAASDDKIAGLAGFGAKTQEKILAGIERMRRYADRHLLSTARTEAEPVFAAIAGHPDVRRALLGGSLRRACETVKDIDILASAGETGRIMDAFTTLPAVARVVAKGPTRSSVTLESGINVDLRVVGDDEFPFAALYFTGSKVHNTDMRGRARKMGYKLNEYGLFRGDTPAPCADEAAVFEALGLDFIPPELRESMGEIEAAERHALPELVTEGDIRGLFHVHTTYSDGAATLSEMAGGARALGLEYLGIADHSRTPVYANGLSVERLREQAEEIAGLNASMDGFTILHGTESDILPDGSLDYPDEVLATLDFVVASVHSAFTLGEVEMTSRIIRAVENPHTTWLGHPTGRLLLGREGYAVDLDAVIDACAACGVMIEINAHPSRLDLDWRHVRTARDRGVRIVICPDAHSVDGLAHFRYGVGVARKGWLRPADVLNTRSAGEVRAIFEARRKKGKRS